MMDDGERLCFGVLKNGGFKNQTLVHCVNLSIPQYEQNNRLATFDNLLLCYLHSGVAHCTGCCCPHFLA